MTKEINPAYGEIFEELCEQRGYGQSDFSSVGISHSALSRFEKGESMLQANKLFAALECIHIGVDEYSYFVNGFHEDYSVKICYEIEKAYYQQDFSTLERINADAKEYDYPLIYLATQNLLHGLTEAEKETLNDIFVMIDNWTYFELSILSFTIDALGSQLCASIMEDFWSENFHYMKIERYRDRIVQTCLRAAMGFIQKGMKETSRRILRTVWRHLEIRDVYARNEHNFMLGLWTFKFKDEALGRQKMMTTVNILNEIGCRELGIYHQKMYEELTK